MITIRRSNDNDIPQLEKLFLITRQHTFVWESPDKFKLEDFKQATVREIILVAEDDDVIVGFISVWTQDAIPICSSSVCFPVSPKKKNWNPFDAKPSDMASPSLSTEMCDKK